jgi:hypothetical protein
MCSPQLSSSHGEGAMRSLDAHLAVIRRSGPSPGNVEEQGHVPDSNPHGLLERMFAGVAVGSGRTVAVEQVRRHRWFSVYARFEKIVAYNRGEPSSAAIRLEGVGSEIWLYWNRLYRRHDDLANIYMAAYRSTYIIIIFLASIALVAAVCALAWPSQKITFTAIEFIALIILAFMIFLSQKNKWHGRAVQFRLTAELTRKQSFLSLLAETVPLPRSTRIGGAADFSRYLRASPISSGSFSPEKLRRISDLVARDLLDDQKNYHVKRAKKMTLAGKRLALASEALFIATIILVFIKLILLFSGFSYSAAAAIGIMSAILPAIAAFSVGVRSYAEFDLMANQSAEMAAYMAEANERWAKINCDAPNASQEMGNLLREICIQMLVDVQGWSAVARSKPVEAG